MLQVLRLFEELSLPHLAITLATHAKSVADDDDPNVVSYAMRCTGLGLGSDLALILSEGKLTGGQYIFGDLVSWIRGAVSLAFSAPLDDCHGNVLECDVQISYSPLFSQPTLWSKIFKQQLQLGHSEEAYSAMIGNPDPSR